MPEDLINNFAQFLGEDNFLKPSLLIPQGKINQFLQDYFKEVKNIDRVHFDFSKDKCRVTFMINLLIKFSVDFDIAAEGIAFADNTFSIGLKRITQLRFTGGSFISRLILKVIYFFLEKILKIDLLQFISKEEQNLLVSGKNIEINFKPEEMDLPEESKKWLILLGDKITPEELQFVDGGVRLTFSVHGTKASD
ncbi:MAG: hypothetical protein P8048_05700 [Calditrichia bacterium]